MNHLLTSDPVRVSEVYSGRLHYSNYFASLMTLHWLAAECDSTQEITMGMNMTASKRMTFQVAKWRHNLWLSNWRHSLQRKVCTDWLQASVVYCCTEQLPLSL